MVQKNSKEVNLRHKKILEDLLKIDENKECSDCCNKGPLWASTNIGVFLCIKCAGCHRKLGTHISTVRSVNLDEWTPSQISNISEKGNAKVNSVYEATLNPRNKPDSNTDDRTREEFIKAKYDKKEFYSKSGKEKEDVEKLKQEKEEKLRQEKEEKLKKEEKKRKEEEKKRKEEEKKKEVKKEEPEVKKVVQHKKVDSNLIQFESQTPSSSMNDLFSTNLNVTVPKQSVSAPTTPQDRKTPDDIFGTQITNQDLISLTDNTTKKQSILSIFDQQPTKTNTGFNQGGFNQGGFNQGGMNQGGFNQQNGFNQQQGNRQPMFQNQFQQIPMQRNPNTVPQRNPYVIVNNQQDKKLF